MSKKALRLSLGAIVLPCEAFTVVVKYGEPMGEAMRKGNNAEEQSGQETTAQVRATLSFPPDVYQSLKAIAKQKKVSLAWVVREAAEQYLNDKWPLLGKQA